MIKLINDDCMKVLPTLPSKSVDLILCDLPYGATAAPDDVPLPLPELWAEYNRIIKENGVIALFAQGLFYVDLVNSNRKAFRYDLIWDKVLTSGFLNAKRQPLRQHEQIAIFYKRPPTYNPQMRAGKPSHPKGNLYLTKEPTNQNYGAYKPVAGRENSEKYPTSIVTFQKPHPSVALHKTQKSVELCEWIIKTYTNEGDLVLDNCMGSGTTGRAAVRTGRNFIGIELNPQNYEIAKKEITA